MSRKPLLGAISRFIGSEYNYLLGKDVSGDIDGDGQTKNITKAILEQKLIFLSWHLILCSHDVI